MSEELLNKILIEVIDLKHHVHGHMFTKDEWETGRDEIVAHIDGFIKLHETLDLELVALRSKVDRLEGRIGRVESHLGLAEVI